MKNLICSAVVTLVAASTAQAQQAVQWRVQDGGNGHWYAVLSNPPGVHLPHHVANVAASARGAHLVTLASQAESNAVQALVVQGGQGHQAWIGLRQVAGSPEPSQGWQWVTGEPVTFLRWDAGQPDDQGCSQPGAVQDFGCISGVGPAWDDHGDPSAACPSVINRAIIEWSADCNNDGVVDYGQILQGQLPDTNVNGVPDGCECATSPNLPACCVGDLNQDGAVDGADLGTLLNAWGTCPGTCPADFDRNGLVDGADLGAMLGRWGPCG